MLSRVARLSLVGLAVLAVGQGMPAARAAGLVEGGYLAEGLGPPVEVEAGRRPGEIDLGGLALSFTPREPFGASAGAKERELELPTLRLSLAGGETDRARLGTLDLGTQSTVRGAATSSSTSFEIGGAFEWQSWSVGATYVEVPDLDGETRLLGATVGYGRIGARLAFGQTERAADPGDREFWLFSTNLAARSWLSLEGDVGYMPGQETAPSSAVGRVGLRLRF